MKVMDLKSDFVSLLKEINNGNEKKAREMVTHIMTNADANHLSIMYRLICHLHKYKPDLAYHLFGGVIIFGGTLTIQQNKPLFDYFAMEIFDDFCNTAGWDILKNLSNVLHTHVPCFTADEPIFIYILRRIITQLKADEMNPTNASQLCYKLPHEKSFTWGWYVNYLAPALFFNSFERKRYSEKTMRKCLMNYRKYITKLSSIVIMRDYKVKPQPWTPINTWEEIVHCVSKDEYKHIDEIVNVAQEQEQEQEQAQEQEQEQEQAQAQEQAQEQAQAQEPAQEPAPIIIEPAPPATAQDPPIEKNKPTGLNWVYSLFGWS
jgi:hypothetical protein